MNYITPAASIVELSISVKLTTHANFDDKHSSNFFFLKILGLKEYKACIKWMPHVYSAKESMIGRSKIWTLWKEMGLKILGSKCKCLDKNSREWYL